MKPLRQLFRRPYFFITVALFFVHAFFMFYNLQKWASFGWDQVDNAWAAVRILVVRNYPLVGMVAKGNSGMYIGPLYYYFVSIFYAVTFLHPIAAPLIAGCTALFSFWVIYYVTRGLFTVKVAVASCFIYTFSSFIIHAERMQWPVNFIAPVGLLIFYFLYKILTGETKYAIHLAAAVGISFHVHFTAIFYPIIVLLAVPFISFKKYSWKYILLSIPALLVFFIPQAIYYIQAKTAGGISNYSGYFQTYYHGLHLQRMLQLSHDAFIKFQSILETPYAMLRNAVFFYIPLFFIAYRNKQKKSNRLKLFYLIALWVMVPWVIFTTYSGEISDYYFNIQMYLAIMIFAYVTVWIWESRIFILRAAIGVFWIYYAVANIQMFFRTPEGNFFNNQSTVRQSIDRGELINFVEGDPKSYLGFYYSYIRHKPLPFEL